MGLLSVQASGLGSTIYGTHETVQTALDQYIQSQLSGSPAVYGSPGQNFFPKNANAGYESGLIMQAYGLGPSQVNLANAWGSFMNTHSNSQTNAISNLLSQSGTSLGKYQAGAVQYLGELGTVHTQAQFNQVLQRFIQNGGMDQISSHARTLLTAATHSGHLSSETQALAMAMQGWTPMNVLDTQQAHAQTLALTRSNMASALTGPIGFLQGVGSHPGEALAALGTIGGVGALGLAQSSLGGLLGARLGGLFGRFGSTGGTAADVMVPSAIGETSSIAGSGVATGLDVGNGVATGGASSVLDMVGGLARSAPLIGTGVSMLMDVPHMLSQMQHGQAGKGIGGMVGTGAGAWGGFLGGAAIAAPLDPFTFGLASLVGGGIGAFAGSTLGRHLGSWLGGAVTGEKSATQYGTMQIQQLEVGQLWIQSVVGAPRAIPHPTALPSGAAHAGAVSIGEIHEWVGPNNPANPGTSPGGIVPNIPLNSVSGLSATELHWLPDVMKTLQTLPHKSPLLTPALMMSVIADQSSGHPHAVGHDSNGTYDAGLMQVNSSNFSAYGLTPQDALHVMANLKAGATILNQDLQRTHSVAGGLYAYGGVGPAATQGMDAMLAILKEISAAIKAQTKLMNAHPLSIGTQPHVNMGLLPKRGK